jgi:hypothetical protein
MQTKKLRAIYRLLQEEARSEALRLLIRRFELKKDFEAVRELRLLQEEEER